MGPATKQAVEKDATTIVAKIEETHDSEQIITEALDATANEGQAIVTKEDDAPR